jgi:hypothetical protein
MMKPTGLLTATGLLVVLGGTVWYFNKHPKTPDTPASAASPKILTIPEDQISEIRIVKTGADLIDLRNLAGKWVIAEPKQMPADQDIVKTMTGALATFNSDRLIDDKPSDLNGFGLATPVEEVDVTLKSGTVNKLLFGSDTPSGSDVYVKVADKPAVYSAFSSSKTTFDKSVADLRDKRLLPFNQDKLTAVTITSKGPAYTFGKNAKGEWQITKPAPMRADATRVDDIVRRLKEAKMDTTPTDQKEVDKQFATGSEVGSASVTDDSGTMGITVKKGKDNSYYAKSSAVEGIYKLSGDLGDGLKDKPVDDFRNKKLFEFGFSDPTKIEIDGAAYQKSGDKWTGPKGQMDSGSIQEVIDKLRDFAGSKFIDKMSGSQALVLSVTSGDTHKVEKVTINKTATEYAAQREGDPAVYVIDAASYGDLQKAITGIKPAAPAPANKDKK